MRQLIDTCDDDDDDDDDDDSDVDECRLGYCHQLCDNSPGNYSCSCFAGFTLDNDKQNCSGSTLHALLLFVL